MDFPMSSPFGLSRICSALGVSSVNTPFRSSMNRLSGKLSRISRLLAYWRASFRRESQRPSASAEVRMRAPIRNDCIVRPMFDMGSTTSAILRNFYWRDLSKQENDEADQKAKVAFARIADDRPWAHVHGSYYPGPHHSDAPL